MSSSSSVEVLPSLSCGTGGAKSALTSINVAASVTLTPLLVADDQPGSTPDGRLPFAFFGGADLGCATKVLVILVSIFNHMHRRFITHFEMRLSCLRFLPVAFTGTSLMDED